MASPQLEDGYVQLALDLLAALLGPGLTDEQRIIMVAAVTQAYGPEKRKVFALDLPELEQASGIHRNCLRRGLRLCVVEGYLTEDGGLYGLVKDWESHTPKGRAREPRSVRFIRWVATKFGIRKGRKGSVASAKTPSASACETSEMVKRQRLRIEGDGQAPALGPGAYATGVRGDMERTHAPASEDLRTETRESIHHQGEGGTDSPSPDPEKTRRNRIADRIAAEVFGAKDSVGNADPDLAASLACWIGTASEAAAVAGALEAKRLARRDPVRYFIGMCQNGLKEPTGGTRTIPAAKPAPKALTEEDLAAIAADHARRFRPAKPR